MLVCIDRNRGNAENYLRTATSATLALRPPTLVARAALLLVAEMIHPNAATAVAIVVAARCLLVTDPNVASNLARNCLNTAAMPPSPAATLNRIAMTALRAQLAVSNFLRPSLPPLCAADVPSLATRQKNAFLATTQTAGPCPSSRTRNMSKTKRAISLSETET